MRMWGQTKIKPNDQSLVGRYIKQLSWSEGCAALILSVGTRKVFYKFTSNNEESTGDLDLEWIISDVAPQIENVRMAPTLLIYNNGHVGLSSKLYSCLAEVEKDHAGEMTTIIWPAPLCNDGFYHFNREVK